MDIMSLDHLAQEIGGQIPPIAGIGGIMVEPKGFVIANILKLVLPCWALELVYSSSCSHGLPGFLVLRRALLFWGIFVRGFARRDLC